MSREIIWKDFDDIDQIENRFREELANILRDVKRSYKFGDIKIDEVIASWRVPTYWGFEREPDIVLFVEEQLFLIIECKRAIDYSTWDEFPIGQAYAYALLARREGYRADFVATANQYSMTFFKVPEDLEKFANWKYIWERKYDKAFRRYLYQKAKYGELYVDTIDYFLIPTKEQLYSILKLLIEQRRKIQPSEPFNLRVIKKLRGFVKFISYLSKELIKDHIEKNLKKEFENIRKKRGLNLTYEQISKEFAYTLMNRIIFYKILERYWRNLDKLEPLYGTKVNGDEIRDGRKYFETLKKFFQKAVEITKDFEPVFILEFHDKLVLPDRPIVLKAIDSLIIDLNRIEIEKLGDVIGYVYEEIIPKEERHQFGQFYTPHGVAELITKWCIRSSSDRILDPGSGSGTFLVEAYKRLYMLKTGKKLEGLAEGNVHKQILEQLYAIDIDEFACHLTAINLAIKNILEPSSNLNIIPSDFFLRKVNQTVYLPYRIQTVEGLKEREIVLKPMDCVVGNPPYTAWDEITIKTKEWIREVLKKEINTYNLLRGGIRQRQNPHIYVFWIMHATKFLKPNGRLGMIISNLWLQTDYGIKFGNFLLDHFKIKAIIDIPLRLFTALITTTVILLEKCNDERERYNNETTFIRIPNSVEDIEADLLLNCIEKKECNNLFVNRVKQENISRESKWLRYFFKSFTALEKSPKSCLLGDLYEINKGNTEWHILTGGAGDGAQPFFHLKPETVEERQLNNYVHPAITDIRDVKFFTFGKSDWEALKNENKRCYMFICHKPRTELENSVLEYIKWGETDCRVSKKRGQGVICSKTAACKTREKRKGFYGWYDLGGVRPAQILAVYQAWHKTRFTLCEFPVATYHGILCFFPRNQVKLTKKQLKALLAYLNSSFAQFYIETEGRKSGGGIIALEISQAEKMPVLDPRKLSDKENQKLAFLFDTLEAKAREIGGATKREQIEKLEPILYRIDEEIAKILDIEEKEIRQIQETVKELINRRVSAARSVKRSAIRGEEPIVEIEEAVSSEDNQIPYTCSFKVNRLLPF